MSINEDQELAESLVRTKQRVSDHGEVFTPGWLVKDMLNLVEDESGSGAVALRQVAFEETDPVVLGGGSGGGGVFEHAAHGQIREHLLLDAAEDFGEIELSGVRFARHMDRAKGLSPKRVTRVLKDPGAGRRAK